MEAGREKEKGGSRFEIMVEVQFVVCCCLKIKMLFAGSLNKSDLHKIIGCIKADQDKEAMAMVPLSI